MKNIVLIGMMGCGKTTVSQLLAKQLNRPLVDIDEYVVNKYQMTIPEMFEISEAYFRERETLCCQAVSQLENTIISTGGGIIKNKINCEALRKNSILIYLDRPLDNILDDVDTSSRPLLKAGKEKLSDLYKERHEIYLMECDYHILNHSSLQEVVNKIIAIIDENK